MTILKKNQSLQIVISETELIMVLTYQFEINKISRSKAVDVYNFYDHLLNRKRFAIVYSPYKNFVENGITYQKKNKSKDIVAYTIKIRKNKTLFKKKFILINRDPFRK